MAMSDKALETRKELLQQIIDNMKNGYVLPPKLWDSSAESGSPHNPVSNARYKGGNCIRLMLASLKYGYTDTRWLTYKQAQEKGWQVKKGSKGVQCEKYIFERMVEAYNPDTGKVEKVKERLDKPIINCFTVFNAAQIEGIPEEESRKVTYTQDEADTIAKNFIASSECKIDVSTNGEAYYSPAKDCIFLPPKKLFLDSTAYLSVALHEMVHSTGHESRLNRELGKHKFGTEGYAREELRAELGSFFTQTDIGVKLDRTHFDQHTKYLESWIGVLKKDPNELFRACADASRAAERLVVNYNEYCQSRAIEEEKAESLEAEEDFEIEI